MTTRFELCPIWVSNAVTGEKHEAYGYYDPQTRVLHVEHSARAAEGFVLPEVVLNSTLIHMSDEQRARLTTWLIDQRNQGNGQPLITEDIVRLAKDKLPLAPYIRVERLLRLIGEQTTVVGTSYDIRMDNGSAYAWSESTSEGEIGFLIDYMIRKGWLDSQPRVTTVGFGEYEIPALVRVTVDGRSRIAEQLVNVDSAHAFIAMWFDESTAEALEKAINPAIEEAGFKPLRIDRMEHINKINDEIIAQIRRSRFLVADFTHGEDGARGGVYYEAGFAHGLGLPVIFTCKNDSVDKLHFDTNHYNHIVWTTPEDLRKKLKNRILAVIGEGPESLKNA